MNSLAARILAELRQIQSLTRQALAEIRGGRKRSHWMWFVFPQARSMGRSSTAAFYGIESLEEA